jgi:acetyl esterase/lipase
VTVTSAAEGSGAVQVGPPPPFDPELSPVLAEMEAGGVAELHVWPGGHHGFATIQPQAALSHAAVAAQRTWLRRLLS